MPVHTWSGGASLTALALRENFVVVFTQATNNWVNIAQAGSSAFTNNSNLVGDVFLTGSNIASGAIAVFGNTGSASNQPGDICYLPLAHAFDPFDAPTVNTSVWESGAGGTAGGMGSMDITLGSMILTSSNNGTNGVGGSSIIFANQATNWNLRNGSDWHVQIPLFWFFNLTGTGSNRIEITLYPSGTITAGSQPVFHEINPGSIRAVTGSTTLDIFVWGRSGTMYAYTGGAVLAAVSGVDISALGSGLLRIASSTYSTNSIVGSTVITMSEVRALMNGSCIFQGRTSVGSPGSVAFYNAIVNSGTRPVLVNFTGAYPGQTTFQCSNDSGVTFSTFTNQTFNNWTVVGSQYAARIERYTGSIMPGSNYAGWNLYGYTIMA